MDLKENERLNLEREQELLVQALNYPAGHGMIDPVFEDEASLSVLHGEMESGGHHLWHYSGHGTKAFGNKKKVALIS